MKERIAVGDCRASKEATNSPEPPRSEVRVGRPYKIDQPRPRSPRRSRPGDTRGQAREALIQAVPRSALMSR